MKKLLFNKKLVFAIWTKYFSVMCFAKKNFKIFNSIIIFNSVDVVNNFVACKFSSDILLHNKSMFLNVFSRFFWIKNYYISRIYLSSSAFIAWMIFSARRNSSRLKRGFVWFRQATCSFVPRNMLRGIKPLVYKMCWMDPLPSRGKKSTKTFFRAVFSSLPRGMKYFSTQRTWLRIFFNIKFIPALHGTTLHFTNIQIRSFRNEFFPAIFTRGFYRHAVSFFIIISLQHYVVNNYCYAAAPSRVSSYVSGTTIRASEVTANEDAIFTYLQAGTDTFSPGSILNVHIGASAGIGASKLDLSSISQNISLSGSLTATSTALFSGDVDISGSLDMNSKQIDNVLDPTAAQDAATMNYVDGKFNTTTGHDHDGSDSKKVIATNLDMSGITNSHILYNNNGTLAGKAETITTVKTIFSGAATEGTNDQYGYSLNGSNSTGVRYDIVGAVFITYFPIAGTLKNFYTVTNSSSTFTIYKNNSPTTITTSGTGAQSDLTHTVSVSVGDYCMVYVQGGASTTYYRSWSIEFDPS